MKCPAPFQIAELWLGINTALAAAIKQVGAETEPVRSLRAAPTISHYVLESKAIYSMNE